jgi:hypothetical protein
MALRFLLDENLRSRALWVAIQQHNAHNPLTLDAVRVGDPSAPPTGTPDPDLLLWCEGEGRVLLSLDKGSLPVHLARHLQAGRHCPGIFIARLRSATQDVVDDLVLKAHAGDPAVYADCIVFIP